MREDVRRDEMSIVMELASGGASWPTSLRNVQTGSVPRRARCRDGRIVRCWSRRRMPSTTFTARASYTAKSSPTKSSSRMLRDVHQSGGLLRTWVSLRCSTQSQSVIGACCLVRIDEQDWHAALLFSRTRQRTGTRRHGRHVGVGGIGAVVAAMGRRIENADVQDRCAGNECT